MSQALTKVEAYGREIDEPVTKKFHQILVLYTTGLATDVTYDFNNTAGTFWTAALADPTYGATGTTGLAVLNAILSLQLNYRMTIGTQLQNRTKVGAGGLFYATSAAIATGTSVTATVTGLLATDTILSVTQATANVSQVVPVAYGSPGAGTLPLTYASANGGSGTVQVLAYRGTGTQVVSKGQYSEVISGGAPAITYASSDAPTSAVFYLEWDMTPGSHPVKYPVP